jgi:hypothetical protein
MTDVVAAGIATASSSAALASNLLELQLQLVEQVSSAFGGLPVLLALHPGDQELQVRHHRLSAGSARLGLLPRCALSGERRL